MPGFQRIPESAISIGRAISQSLWLRVRNSFISHEERIDRFETSSRSFPAGTVIEFAGTTAPTGWLLCDGSVQSQLDYPDLYAAILSEWDTGGEGVGNFRLPATARMTPIGSGAGSGLTSRTLGDAGGDETHALSTAELGPHTHTLTDPGHQHGDVRKILTAAGAQTANRDFTGASVPPTHQTDLGTTGITINSSGGGGATADGHNNVQPSLVLNYIIKT